MSEPKPTTEATVTSSSIPHSTHSRSDTIGGQPTDAPPVPGRIGEYVVLGELGRGGMGVVYRAEDPRLKREVALKVMLPQFAANPQAKARFVREARAQAKVEHDHVAAIFAVNDHDGLPYLVMPLLKGMTLQAALKANPRPPLPEVVRIGREMAEGLAAAHEKGLVHRDIKPANVWLEGKKLRVKVLDFGLARVSDAVTDVENAETGPVTHEGAIVGTPAYMSPEQARGDSIDGRTDLWSLGVVLYQMTTGELPFNGKSVMAILARLAADNPAPPITKNAAVPPQLSDCILRLLAKNPAYRPPTAEIAAEELRAIELGGVNAVRVIPLSDVPPIIVDAGEVGPDPFADLNATEINSTPDAEPVDEPHTTRVAPEARARSGFPIWAMVVGVLLLVGVIVGGVVSQMGKKPEPEVAKEEPPRSPAKKENPKKEPAVPADAERAAADLFHPYSLLVVRLANPVRDVIISSDQQLPAEPFTLQEIRIAAHAPVPPDFGAKVVPSLTRLSELVSFVDQKPVMRWSGEQLEQLAGNTAIREKLVNFHADFDPSPKAWEAIKKFPLRDLAFSGERITDDMVAGLPQLGELRRLEIMGLGRSKNLTAKGWAALLNARKVDYLGLAGPSGLNPEVCKVLAGVPGLESLYLSACEFDDASMRELVKAPTLRTLNLIATTIPDSACTHLAGIKTLTSLNLYSNKLPQAGLDALAGATQLRGLQLGETGVTEEQVKKLNAALPRCTINWDKGIFEPSDAHFREAKRWLEAGVVAVKLASGKTVAVPTPVELPDEEFSLTQVRRSYVTADETLKHLAPIPTLTHVELLSSAVSAKGLRALLSSREALTSLTLRGLPDSVMTNEMLEVLGEFSNLTYLNIAVTQNPNPELKPLAKLIRLETLWFQESDLTDEALKHVCQLPKLVELRLASTPISDASVDTLAGMKQLTTLELRGTRITKAGYEKLKAALPNGGIVWEDPTRAIVARLLTRGCLFAIKLPDGKVLSDVKKPEQLPPGPFTVRDFGSNIAFTDADMLWLEAFPGLALCHLHQGHKVTAVGLRSLLPHKGTLTLLRLLGGELTEDGLRVIGQLTELKEGGFTTKMPKTGLQHLAGWKQPAFLNFSGSDISDAALAGLVEVKMLRSLRLADTPISDAGVEHLAKMTQLTSLNVMHTRVTKAGYDKLKAALPKCGIEWDGKPCDRVFPGDDWVSLGPILDPKKDHAGGVGTWVRTDAGVEGTHNDAGNMVRLRAPLTVKGDYELEVEFTRPKDALNAMVFETAVGPNNGIAVILSNGGKAGLGLINGQDFDKNGTAKDFLLGNDKRIRALLRVRATGPMATVETDIDGKPLLAWKGKPETLSIGSGLFVPGTIDLCFGPPGKIVIHSVRFRVLEGSASLTRPEDAATVFEAKKP